MPPPESFADLSLTAGRHQLIHEDFEDFCAAMS
jgi:hypothetical protein